MIPLEKAKTAKEGPATGAVLAYEFRGGQSVVGSDGCRLRLENQSTKKSSFMTLKPDGAAFATLAPGLYQLRRLGCGLTKVWDLRDLLPAGFSVEPGRVSYLGKVTFVFKDEDLVEVKKGSRIEGAEGLPLALDRVPPGAQESVISGYTGKAITRAMREGDLREAFDVFGKGTSDSTKALPPLLESLKNCAMAEAKTDPLRLGTLQVVAAYKDQRFVKFQEQSGQNAFSDAFVTCIEKSHEEFRPDVPGDLTIRTRY
jgi:hypothetical protein